MNQITTAKIENGTLTLPRSVRKLWQNKEVLILPEKDRLIVQPLEAEWDSYEEKVSKGRKQITSRMIDKAVAWAKNNRK